jgi:hypothetical protein
MTMPLWIKNSLIILLCISFAAWIAGERIRILDERYILNNLREDKIKLVSLLSGLVANAVLTKDDNLIDSIIKNHLSNWPEITFVNIADDRSNVIYTWQKSPINFNQGVRHFEKPVIVGGQEFGRLSVYFDLSEYYEDVEEHIMYTRRSAASILLSITLMLVFLVNFVAINKIIYEKKPENQD